MSEGDTRYDVVRAGPKGGWSLMHGREGITALYEDTRDLQEVAVFGEPFLALANLVAAELTRIAAEQGKTGPSKAAFRAVEAWFSECLDCGRAHTLRDTGTAGHTWADPDDGHSYRPRDSRGARIIRAGLQERTTA